MQLTTLLTEPDPRKKSHANKRYISGETSYEESIVTMRLTITVIEI